MIATLNGRLKLRDSSRLIIEAAGLGYEVFIPLSTYYRVPALGAAVELEIRQVVREDAIMLYGFATAGEKAAFDLLLGVPHVGPKLALAVLSVLSPRELVTAVGEQDVTRIDAVPGVGPKVAERIVRELRDRVGGLAVADAAVVDIRSANGHAGAASLLDDALSALINLGYKPAEAKRAVDEVAAHDRSGGLEVIIRKALAVLLGEK